MNFPVPRLIQSQDFFATAVNAIFYFNPSKGGHHSELLLEFHRFLQSAQNYYQLDI